MRTAESVVLTLCPPGPLLRKMSMRMSLSLMSISTSSTSGKHRDTGGAGVDAPLAFGHRDALHPVDAGFILETAIRALALDGEDHFLEAAHVAFALAEQLDLVVVDFGPARVHAIQFAGKERGFLAARPGAHLDDDVLVVVGVFGQEQHLELLFQLGVLLLQLGHFQLGQFLHVGVAVVLRQFLVLLDLLFHTLKTAERLDQFLQLAALLGQLVETRIVGDDLRVSHQPIQFIVAGRDRL